MNSDKKNIQIKISIIQIIIVFFVDLINRFLIFLQLRTKRQYWGVVYDSVSKQPLDPVKVSLVYADTGKLEDSRITDLNGRYGFLARPGKFKILVNRTNYIFPSNLIKGDKDGIYKDIYHGEFFELLDTAEVVAPNIPMDPIEKDWNQKEKQKLVKTNFYFEWFVEKFIRLFFWFGVIYCLILLYLKQELNIWFYALVGFYFFVFFFELMIPRSKFYGRVFDSKTGLPVEGVILQLIKADFPNINFGKSTTSVEGKFFLLANSGKYILKIFDKNLENYLGDVKVKIGKIGVLNKDIWINYK